MYYAVSRAYGLGTVSDGDCLARFETKDCRDAFVAGEKPRYGKYYLESVTRDYARYRFPRAFRDDHPIIDADEWTSYDGSIVRMPKPNHGEPQWSRHSTGAQWFHED